MGLHLFVIPEILLCDISGIKTKAPCEMALMGERHVCIEISDFVMLTFILDFFKKTWYNYIVIHKDK